jgi:hypothetical protein
MCCEIFTSIGASLRPPELPVGPRAPPHRSEHRAPPRARARETKGERPGKGTRKRLRQPQRHQRRRARAGDRSQAEAAAAQRPQPGQQRRASADSDKRADLALVHASRPVASLRISSFLTPFARASRGTWPTLDGDACKWNQALLPPTSPVARCVALREGTRKENDARWKQDPCGWEDQWRGAAHLLVRAFVGSHSLGRCARTRDRCVENRASFFLITCVV